MFEFPSSIKFRHKKVGRKSQKEIEPQEIFLDQLARVEVPLSKKILKGILLFFIVFIFVLFAKTFQFQILENKKYSVLANENKFIFHSIIAARGVIYDSQGEQLVFNESSFDLVLDKDKLPEDESERIRVLEEVSEIINQDYHEFENKDSRDAKAVGSLESRISDIFSGLLLFFVEYSMPES